MSLGTSYNGKGSAGSSSAYASSVKVSSGRHSSGGLSHGGGHYAGSHRGGNMSIGGGHSGGFTSSSAIVGGTCGFGGGAGFVGGTVGGGAGFGSGAGFGGGAGQGFGSGFGGGFGDGSGFGSGSGFGFGGGHGSGFGYGQDQGLLNINEKITMQNLNDRLASYLDKVRSLEDANADLEKKIRHWYETHGPKPREDYSHYFRTIEDLQRKIQEATTNNGRVVLQIDNARLAADDFKMKFDNERFLRQSVEADLNGLKKVLDELTITKNDLQSQIENLKDEIAALKRNHEEEMRALSKQVQGTINVDVNAAPATDLQRVLGNIRHEYEDLIAKNQKEVENWYHIKNEELSHQLTKDSTDFKSSQTEVIELKRTFQSLEIELQSQLSMKAALEASLSETEGRYCMDLAHIQSMIQNVEQELANIRCEMENQSQEYKLLLDTKARLEQEISTYRSLLDGQGTQSSRGSYEHSSSSGFSSSSQSDRAGSGGSHHSDGRATSTRDQHLQSGYRK
ncbi:keratin, type I cytoskeletal 19-like [Hyperolius riggenbachi]|uniref:keratin, type I cytoskeletal 19-like n=1 Tax=Hyperolius riggenbachi TaxID=752182 RepID=UPI0035A386C3